MRATSAIIISIFVFACVLTPKAQADSSGASSIIIDPAIMYLYDHTNSSGSVEDVSHYLLDLRAGYKFDSPLYVGALYTLDNKVDSTGSSTTDNIGAWALSVGLVTDDIYLLVDYYVSAEEKIQTGGSTTHDYTSGSGFQVALGYKFLISGTNFAIAPQINYRSIHYSTDSAGSSDYTHGEFLPYVAFWFMF